ncbi:hypothetical protein [Kitasatospora sp. NPDC059327]|uniref:hypothetical protein n=1 Tax=Kitasatospora sp. NPDC059327 TaxID=3346803 RepID=UPI0036CF6028
MRGSFARRKRTENGLLGASACLLLGIVAHVAGGGRLPGPAALGGLFAVLTILVVALFHTRVGRHVESMVSVFAALQLALHLALDRLSEPARAGAAQHHHAAAPRAVPRAGDGPAVPPDAPRYAVDRDVGPGVLPTPEGAGAATVAGDLPSCVCTVMTLTHALATFGTALLLIHGDRNLRRLATLVVRRLILPVLRCPAPRRPAPPISSAPVPRLRGVLLARCVPGRGPPAVAGA